MAKTMADYLTDVTADYTTVELSVAPHNVMVEHGEKEQFIHRFSDGQKGIVTMSDTPRFKVTLQWDVIDADDTEAILDMWMNRNKANGMARSFYWVHPTDGNTYTVKFLSALPLGRRARLPGYQNTEQVELDILGTKPV